MPLSKFWTHLRLTKGARDREKVPQLMFQFPSTMVSIGPSLASSSAVPLSSGPDSHAVSPARSRRLSAVKLSHARARSFVVWRPLVRIVELLLDFCDTALEINVPSIKESKSPNKEDFKIQSPHSESRISQVLQWQQPSSLENEPRLAALAMDTEKLARAKVEAVHRHQFILEYSERIRQEYMAEVDASISEALSDRQCRLNL